jgi:hypothetical protein
MRTRLALTIVFGFVAAANAQFDWILWDPMAIRADRAEPAQLEIQVRTTGRGAPSGVTAARIDFAGGGSLNLTPLGSGRFSASIPAARLLYDYRPDDLNHNFVGFIRLLDSSNAVIVSFNAFINVVDANTPPAAVITLPNDARQSQHILNLHRPLIASEDVRPAVQQFYSYFPDAFDFVQVVFTLPSYHGNRYHSVIRNDVSGVGLNIYDNTSQYGSAGRLKGVTVFPIDFFFDAGETAFSHEIGHQWINYLNHPKLTPGPHWPPSTMATGVMGFNIPGGGVGGEFNYAINSAGPGTYRLTSVEGSAKEFSDFDLYLMGLIPASAVSPGIVLEGTACENCILAGSTITVDDIIATQGPRLPASTASQKSFRVGTVVISRDRLLNDDEMALLESFAARGEARAPLPYSSGFSKGTTKPFFVATRELATVDLRLVVTPRRRAVRR